MGISVADEEVLISEILQCSFDASMTFNKYLRTLEFIDLYVNSLESIGLTYEIIQMHRPIKGPLVPVLNILAIEWELGLMFAGSIPVQSNLGDSARFSAFPLYKNDNLGHFAFKSPP